MKSPLLYAGLLLVCALFAALIAPVFVDWSNYRTDLEAYGERISGREVLINGDITVTLLPAPVLKVSDIRVSNPEGATSPYLLIARELEATFSLAPLLRGKIEVSSIDIDSPVIEAELLPGGGTWKLEPQGGLDKLLAVDDIRLEDTRIRSGTLVLRDGRRKHLVQLEGLDLTLQAPSLAGPFRARGEFQYSGIRKEFLLSVGRNREDRPTSMSMRVEPGDGWGKVYSLDGKLIAKDGEPAFDGRFRVTEASGDGDSRKRDRAEAGLAEDVPFELRSGIVATLDDVMFDEMQFLLGSGRSRAALTGEARLDIGKSPRLNVKLAARRLDLDAVVQTQSDPENQREGTSAREIIAQVPRLLAFVPKTLSGQLKMDVDGLVLGGQQIEGAGMTLGFTSDRFQVSRAVGRLPGQAQLSVTGTYNASAAVTGNTIFDGIFALQANDAKSFISWALPKTKPILNPQAGGARGKLTLKGELKVSDKLVEMIGVETTLDRTKARFGLSYALTKRPSFGLRVVLDELNVDRYLPRTSARMASGKRKAGTLGTGEEQNRLALLEEFDANIVARADKVIFKGTGLRGLVTDLTLRGGNLKIKDLTFADFGGARIQAKGELMDVVRSPSGNVEASFSADDPTNILALFDIGPSDIDRGTAWVRWARTLGPAVMTAKLEAASSEESSEMEFSATGQFGQSRASFEGQFDGRLDQLAKARIRLQAEIANERGERLLRQLGVDANTNSSDPARPGILRGEVDGSLSGGMELAMGVEAFGTQATVSGNARQVAGFTSVEGEVKLSARDAGPLYDAVGISGSGDVKPGGPVNLRALVAGKDGEYVVTGLTGSVSDVPLNIDGTVDFRGDIPALRFNASLAEISLPWALGLIFKGKGDADAVDRAIAAVGVTSEAVPLWSPAPFSSSILKSFSLDLTSEVGRLKVSDQSAIRNAKLKIKLGDGRVDLSKLTGRLYGGNLTASAEIGSVRDNLSLKISHKIERARLAEMAVFAGSDASVEGELTSEGTWNSNGRSLLALLSSMSGAGTVSMSQVRVRELNGAAFSSALTEARTEQQIDDVANSVLRNGATDFEPIESQYNIASGLAQFEPMQIKSADITGEVRTKVDLPAWRLDSDWRLSFVKMPDVPPLRMLFAGTVGEASRSLDTRDLKAFLTVRTLQDDMDKLEELERRTREEIEKARRSRVIEPVEITPPSSNPPKPDDSASDRAARNTSVPDNQLTDVTVTDPVSPETSIPLGGEVVEPVASSAAATDDPADITDPLQNSEFFKSVEEFLTSPEQQDDLDVDPGQQSQDNTAPEQTSGNLFFNAIEEFLASPDEQADQVVTPAKRSQVAPVLKQNRNNDPESEVEVRTLAPISDD